MKNVIIAVAFVIASVMCWFATLEFFTAFFSDNVAVVITMTVVSYATFVCGSWIAFGVVKDIRHQHKLHKFLKFDHSMIGSKNVINVEKQRENSNDV